MKTIFSGICCMESAPKLVGHSKVMAHLLPNLVPPVDGGHTLKFLYGDTTPPDGIDDGWTKLEELLKEFFYPILKSPTFRAKAEEWLGRER